VGEGRALWLDTTAVNDPTNDVTETSTEETHGEAKTVDDSTSPLNVIT
jgi:hypothetical protein